MRFFTSSGSEGRIRTDTWQILSLLSLPLDYLAMAAPLRVERRIAVSTTLTDLESAVLPLNYGAFTGFSSSLKPKFLRFCRSIALTKTYYLPSRLHCVTRLGPIYPLCRFIHTSAVRTSTTLVFLPSRFSALLNLSHVEGSLHAGL